MNIGIEEFKKIIPEEAPTRRDLKNEKRVLIEAIEKSRLDIVRYLVELRGQVILSASSTDSTIMSAAAKQKDVNIVRYLHEHGKLGFDRRDLTGALPIHIAAQTGAMGIFDYILEHSSMSQIFEANGADLSTLDVVSRIRENDFVFKRVVNVLLSLSRSNNQILKDSAYILNRVICELASTNQADKLRYILQNRTALAIRLVGVESSRDDDDDDDESSDDTPSGSTMRVPYNEYDSSDDEYALVTPPLLGYNLWENPLGAAICSNKCCVESTKELLRVMKLSDIKDIIELAIDSYNVRDEKIWKLIIPYCVSELFHKTKKSYDFIKQSRFVLRLMHAMKHPKMRAQFGGIHENSSNTISSIPFDRMRMFTSSDIQYLRVVYLCANHFARFRVLRLDKRLLSCLTFRGIYLYP